MERGEARIKLLLAGKNCEILLLFAGDVFDSWVRRVNRRCESRCAVAKVRQLGGHGLDFSLHVEILPGEIW